MTVNSSEQPRAAKRRGPRKLTPKRLENMALHYLGRYSASTESLRRVLRRRVRNSAREHGTDEEEGAAWIEALIDKFTKLGYLDDRAYAENRCRVMLEGGKSAYAVRTWLRQKGVSPDLVDAALNTFMEAGGNPDLRAAAVLARRRRLGPYRRTSPGSEELAKVRNRELATLARAGFSFDVAKRVLDSQTVEEVEALGWENDDDERYYIADD